MNEYELAIKELANRFQLIDSLKEIIKQQDDFIEVTVKYLMDHYFVKMSDISYDIVKARRKHE